MRTTSDKNRKESLEQETRVTSRDEEVRYRTKLQRVEQSPISDRLYRNGESGCDSTRNAYGENRPFEGI